MSSFAIFSEKHILFQGLKCIWLSVKAPHNLPSTFYPSLLFLVEGVGLAGLVLRVWIGQQVVMVRG